MIKGAMGSADVQPDDGLDSFQEDGGEHPKQLPERLIIQMPRELGNEYVFIKINDENSLEIIYESERGSNWARTSEGMVLTKTEGKWTVYDSAMLVDEMTIFCRQAVFVADGNITEEGWKTWRYNLGADGNQNNGDYREDWSSRHFWAETKVP